MRIDDPRTMTQIIKDRARRGYAFTLGDVIRYMEKIDGKRSRMADCKDVPHLVFDDCLYYLRELQSIQDGLRELSDELGKLIDEIEEKRHAAG